MHILNQWQGAFIFFLALFGCGLGALAGETEEHAEWLGIG